MEKSNTLSIAGYCRISVDEEADRAENTSIENQKSIISEFVATRFPDAELTFYEDRDRSGYTFEQRISYQRMRKKLMAGEHDILIVKDFSRFARRNCGRYLKPVVMLTLPMRWMRSPASVVIT